MTINFKGVVASAPGKVILFGEHAVVYGVTAIAAALSDLRIFVEIDPTIEETIEVRMHDIVEGPECKSFSRQISLSRLRDLFHESPTADALSPIDPNTVILDKLRKEFQDAPIAAAQGLMAIMYIIANVLPECLWSNTISVAFHGGMLLNINSKGLPIGAGLGSSAAFSVALAAAALRLRQQLYPFLLVGGGENVAIALNETGDSVSSADIDEPLLSNSSATIPLSLLPIINGWAYAAEVVIHGTPSGLDNTTRYTPQNSILESKESYIASI